MKILFIIFFMLFIGVFNAISQPTLTNQKVTGGSANDLFSTMVLTRDGGMIAGGSSNSGISGEKTDTLRGSSGSDYWIVKFDKNGKIEWDKTIGGTGDDQLLSLQQTKDKGYILCGSSTSDASGDKTAPRVSLVDFWIVKLNKNGDIEWDKTYGNFDDGYYYLSRPYNIKQTTDKGYVIAGITTGEDYDSPNVIVKTDALGNMQWYVTVGGEQARPASVEQTKDSGYIVGASALDHIDEITSYELIKLNKSGNIQWQKNYREEYTLANLNAVKELPDGYLLAGNSDGYIDEYKSEDSRGGQDYWLLKVDTAGNKLWDKTIGGSDNDFLRDIYKTYDGGYILGGYSASNASGEKSENNNGGGGFHDYDYWIVKLDKYGSVQWDKTIGGDTVDVLLSIKERRPNQFVLGGYSYSGISGDKTKASRGGADYWFTSVIYNTIATSKTVPENIVAEKHNSNYSIYPNPVSNILYIRNTGKSNFSLISQSGKILLTKTINGNGSINVSHLPAGLYYLKNNKTSVVQKVMIAK